MASRRSPSTHPRRINDPKTPARYEIGEDGASMASDVRAQAWHSSRHVISATAAARSFSELVSRVRYKGETYLIEKGGRPMCELSPVANSRFTGADFLALLGTLPKPAAEFLDTVEEAIRCQAMIESSSWEK